MCGAGAAGRERGESERGLKILDGGLAVVDAPGGEKVHAVCPCEAWGSEEENSSAQMGWLEAWCMMLVCGLDAWMWRMVPSSNTLASQSVSGVTARAVGVVWWYFEGSLGLAVSAL